MGKSLLNEVICVMPRDQSTLRYDNVNVTLHEVDFKGFGKLKWQVLYILLIVS